MQQMRMMRSAAPVDIELVEYDPPGRLRWHITSAGIDLDGDIRVWPTSVNGKDGSTVDWRWLFWTRGWVRLAGPLATWTGSRLERKVWRRLKPYLEANHVAAAADGSVSVSSPVCDGLVAA